MLNLFKKLQKPNATDNGTASANAQHAGGAANNASYRPMGQHLQRKFARGIQYNMKVIIRGDRNVGKTCLFHRLQGDKFIEEYSPSEEIKVTSIQWNYNVSDDIVKVEIWDIVDKGKKRESSNTNSAKPKETLKVHNTEENAAKASEELSMVLDAEFVDVYKGTSGVVFMFDMTKAWTYEYVEKEIRRCPSSIPILILANRRDMGHHRVITNDQVLSLIHQLDKEHLEERGQARPAQIRYAESSMRNGFGLRYLYKFLNLPYLTLQRQTLLKQIERNQSEIAGTGQELDCLMESDENNYDAFLEMITTRRRQLADQLSNVAPDKIAANVHKSASMPANMNRQGSEPNEAPVCKPPPSIIIGANNPLPAKLVGLNQLPPSSRSETIGQNKVSSLKTQNPLQNIEEFIPDDGEQNVFRTFLDDVTAMQGEAGNHLTSVNEEDSDENESLPVIAKYQEDLDPEDLDDERIVSHSPLGHKQVDSDTKQNGLSQEDMDKLESLCNTTSRTLSFSDTSDSQQRKRATASKSKTKRKGKNSAELKEETNGTLDKPSKADKSGLKVKNSKTKTKSARKRDETQELEDFLGGPLESSDLSAVNPDQSAYEML